MFLISHGRLCHNVSQTLGPRPQNARYSDLFSLFLVMKSLPDLFLILGIITSPIFVDPFLVVLTILSSVISDVFLVLLTKYSYQLLRRNLRISEFPVRYHFCRDRICSLFFAQ